MRMTDGKSVRLFEARPRVTLLEYRRQRGGPAYLAAIGAARSQLAGCSSEAALDCGGIVQDKDRCMWYMASLSVQGDRTPNHMHSCLMTPRPAASRLQREMAVEGYG